LHQSIIIPNTEVMKKKEFFQKSLMVIGFIGWSLSGFSQAYKIDRNKVFFDREPIPHADARSFVDLGFGYAKDRNNVYLEGRVLEFVDPATFRLKGRDDSHFHDYGDRHEHGKKHRGYYKTTFNVYYGDKKIDAMASSFKEIGDGYAKDSFSVFYFGKKIEGASASTFKILDDGYSKDSFNVYYSGTKVKDASASSFKVTGEGYAQDTYNAFYRGKKIE